jgi:hypothetical protein
VERDYAVFQRHAPRLADVDGDADCPPPVHRTALTVPTLAEQAVCGQSTESTGLTMMMKNSLYSLHRHKEPA